MYLKKFIIFICFILFFSVNAEAYIDPASGSIMLQWLIGAIAAFVAILSRYKKKLKIIIKRIFNKDSDKKL